MTDRQFILDSGRALGISAVGDALSRRVVVFCLPTPGAGAFDPNPTVTNRWGVQLFAVDRPGYGGSDPLPEGELSLVQDRADDIAAFLARSDMIARSIRDRGIGTIGVVGWSSGGAVALSLAARHPELVDRLAIVGMRAPQSRMHKSEIEAFDRLAPPSHVSVSELVAQLGTRDPFTLGALGIGSEETVLGTLGLRNRLDHMLTDAALQGPIGIATDLVMSRDLTWVRELRDIAASTIVVRGSHDVIARAEDALWLRQRVPNARTVAVEDAGHLAVVNVWKQILEHVAPDHGGIPEELRDHSTKASPEESPS